MGGGCRLPLLAQRAPLLLVYLCARFADQLQAHELELLTQLLELLHYQCMGILLPALLKICAWPSTSTDQTPSDNKF